jgi:pimeloyl-ACP methyl ester carboxylesterase
MSSAATPTSPDRRPVRAAGDITVMLVHGAFADASSWSGVIAILQERGHTVVAPSNPLRGLIADTTYTASVVSQIDGPVLMVGHSYGGAVITNAATTAPNVVGLVFVAAFAPDEGEVLGAVEDGSKDSVLNSALVPRQYPTGPAGQTATEFGIDPAQLHDVFAADLPPQQAAVLAVTQRPVAEAAFTDVSGRRPGNGCRPGRSSRPATGLRGPTSSARWPGGPVRRSWSSRART